MHLSVSNDYTLSTRQIADMHDVKFNHLAKVSQWLVREGFAASQRGRSGGLRLARAPEEINVGTVLRALESHDALVECFRADGGACILSPVCGLTQALNDAREAFFKALDAKTLADLIPVESAASSFVARLNMQPD